MKILLAVLVLAGADVEGSPYRNGPYHPSYRGPYVPIDDNYPIIDDPSFLAVRSLFPNR